VRRVSDLLINYIYFGPKNSGTKLEQLRLPEVGTKTVEYKELGLRVDFRISFAGDTLVVSSIELHNPEGVSTKSLSQLEIPKYVREYVYDHNPELYSLIKSKATDQISLSQLYWAEYVCNGAPRLAFQNQLGIARSTANFHLTKLTKLGLVPQR
jgi:hypothetical protein